MNFRFAGDPSYTVTLWSGGGYGQGVIVDTGRVRVGGGLPLAGEIPIPDFDVDGYNRGGAPVPEPTTLALFGLGLVGMGRVARRKLRKPV